MKFSSSFALAALTSLACAYPQHERDVSNIAASNVKRATVTDTPVGYASTNGGTTGGAGGTTTTVSTLAQITAAVKKGDDSAKVIYVSGAITGANKLYVGSNTSIIGLNSKSSLTGIGLYIKGVSNVIVRNLKINKVLAENGDAIGIQASTNVWIDHNELSSDLDHDKELVSCTDTICRLIYRSWQTCETGFGIVRGRPLERPKLTTFQLL